jgi:hypothetical protein
VTKRKKCITLDYILLDFISVFGKVSCGAGTPADILDCTGVTRCINNNNSQCMAPGAWDHLNRI